MPNKFPVPDDITPEQAQAVASLERNVAGLIRQLRKLREACVYSLTAAEGPRSHVARQLAEAEQALSDLAARKADPGYVWAEQTLTIAQRMFAAAVRVFDIQAVYDRKNLAYLDELLAVTAEAGQDVTAWVRLSESGVLSGDLKFPLPTHDPEYLEARAQSMLYLGLQRWLACIDGIDALMRATVNDTAAESRSPEEEAGRKAMGDTIRAAAQQDRELAMLMGQMGVELQETLAFFQWGSQSLKRAKELSGDAKRQIFLDADWRKVSGKTTFLVGMLERLQPYPAVAQFFPAPQAPELPYEQLEWPDDVEQLAASVPQAGSGRLTPPGTGRLRP